jgi:naphthalene 1,2-dioxygenase system ferredoxin subunit
MSGAGLDWQAIPVPLPEAGATRAFELAGLALLLCNAEGRPCVVRDECPHQRTPLAGGRLYGTVLECPLHGGRLDVRDGAPVAPPIRRATPCYPVRAAGGALEVGLPARGGSAACTIS